VPPGAHSQYALSSYKLSVISRPHSVVRGSQLAGLRSMAKKKRYLGDGKVAFKYLSDEHES
jgi:hypothetical protein